MGQITDRLMSSKPGDKDIWLNESAAKGQGRFCARITPSGERHFYFRYTDSSGSRVRLPLGGYDSSGVSGLTLKEARAKAGEYSRQYQSGILDIKQHLENEESKRHADAAAAKAKAERERLEAEAEANRLANRLNVRQLFEQWDSVHLITLKDGGSEVRRLFKKDVLPIIGDIFVVDTRKGHIMLVIDKLLARGINRQAKITFSLLRQMFSFAVDRELIEHNPTINIRKAKIGGKDVERDRVLSEDQIRQLNKQLPYAHMTIMAEAAIWIALSSCCRISELLFALWEHIDLEKGIWLIPDTKNKRPHTVYLSGFSIHWFRRLKEITGDTLWCYPNTDETGPVCNKTITKQISDRQRPPEKAPMSGRSKHSEALRLPGGKWTPHDLRRTGATLMTMLGVIPEVAERCLNHTEENKVKRIYQRHSYEKEMRTAWALLGERLTVLTQEPDSNVVTLQMKSA